MVPRTWTYLLAEAAGEPIDPQTQTPALWRDYVAQRTGRTASACGPISEMITEAALGPIPPGS